MRVLSGALLGLLAREPLTGTELTTQLQHRLGAAWRAGHSQIYPELSRLESEGFVQHEVVAQSDRPALKRYTVTSTGREQLRSWAAEPGAVSPLRDELLVKLYSGWLVEPGDVDALLAQHEQQHADRAAFYTQLLTELEAAWARDDYALDSPMFSSVALVRRGVGYETEYVHWCRWYRDQLRGRNRDPDADPISDE